MNRSLKKVILILKLFDQHESIVKEYLSETKNEQKLLFFLFIFLGALVIGACFYLPITLWVQVTIALTLSVSLRLFVHPRLDAWLPIVYCVIRFDSFLVSLHTMMKNNHLHDRDLDITLCYIEDHLNKSKFIRYLKDNASMLARFELVFIDLGRVRCLYWGEVMIYLVFFGFVLSLGFELETVSVFLLIVFLVIYQQWQDTTKYRLIWDHRTDLISEIIADFTRVSTCENLIDISELMIMQKHAKLLRKFLPSGIDLRPDI